MKYSDHHILQGLAEKKSESIRFLYRNYFPLIKSIVINNSGNYQDAEDLFQDGLVVLYQKVNKGEINLDCGLRTFFYSICKNIWKQRLDRKWRLLFQENLVNEPSVSYQLMEDENEEIMEKKRIYQTHFLTLPEECRTILRLFLGRVPLKEIAIIVGLKDENYTKVRKYLCKNMLRKRIMKDPRSRKFYFL